MELLQIVAVAVGLTLALFWGAFAATGAWRRVALVVGLILAAATVVAWIGMARAGGWDALSWFLFAAPLLAMALAVLAGLGWRAVADSTPSLAGQWPRALGGLAVYTAIGAVYVLMMLQL